MGSSAYSNGSVVPWQYSTTGPIPYRWVHVERHVCNPPLLLATLCVEARPNDYTWGVFVGETPYTGRASIEGRASSWTAGQAAALAALARLVPAKLLREASFSPGSSLRSVLDAGQEGGK